MASKMVQVVWLQFASMVMRVIQSNWHKLEKHRFARQIADVLYTAANRGEYAQLVLAAPPMIMGDLRKAMHREVSERVVAEISKDLTNMPPLEIERNIVGKPGKDLN